MTNILLCGASGRMGRAIAGIADARDDCAVMAGVDPHTVPYGGFPIYPDFPAVQETADVIIDFSNPAGLTPLLDYACALELPTVIATTGFSEEQATQIRRASEKIPVFFSFNMSLGINLLTALAVKAAQVLGTRFDIEIVEKHHNQKLDAPSGTALMIADAVNAAADGQYHYRYDRHPLHQKRDTFEIGLHSVRGGTIVGEHDVIFAGQDEVLTLSHTALSRGVFAAGAVNAAVFLKFCGPGLYDMNALIGG